MKYKYLTVFYVGGILMPKDKSEILLSESNFNEPNIVLTSNLDAHTFLYDRRNAIGNLVLNAMFGGVNPNPLSEKIDEGITQMREIRNKEFGKGPFLILEFSGETHCDLTESSTDCGDFIIAFDAIDSNQIRKALKPKVNQALASLFLVSKRDYNLKKVTDGIYLLDKDGKIIYSSSISLSATPTISSPLDDDSIKNFSKYIIAILDNADLENVYRLLIQATIEHKDNLRSFLFAWTAMEIFINATFRKYKPKFAKENLLVGKNEKSTLAKNFFSISSFLSKKNDADFQEFKDIKKIRNTFIHGEEVEENTLPTHKIIKLLKKYLILHLEYGN